MAIPHDEAWWQNWEKRINAPHGECELGSPCWDCQLSFPVFSEKCREKDEHDKAMSRSLESEKEGFPWQK